MIRDAIDDFRFRRHVRSLGLGGHSYDAEEYPEQIKTELGVALSQCETVEHQLERAHDRASVEDLAGAAAAVRSARWELLYRAAALESLQRSIEDECDREHVLRARAHRTAFDEVREE